MNALVSYPTNCPFLRPESKFDCLGNFLAACDITDYERDFSGLQSWRKVAPTMISDEALMLESQGGSREAFEQLFARGSREKDHVEPGQLRYFERDYHRRLQSPVAGRPAIDLHEAQQRCRRGIQELG